MENFKKLSDEEVARLSNSERRAYLKQLKEYNNAKLITDTLQEAEEDRVVPNIPINKPEVDDKPIEKPAPIKVKEEKPVEKKENVKNETLVQAKKNTVGRPKGKPITKISINVPAEFEKYIDIASGINFKGNVSSYISSLIEKDIAENKKIYDQIYKMRQ